jgi:hypothetical protein
MKQGNFGFMTLPEMGRVDAYCLRHMMQSSEVFQTKVKNVAGLGACTVLEENLYCYVVPDGWAS